MNDSIREISIIVLMGLAFFCLQAGVFLLSGHTLKNNSRRTLVLLQIITGILLIFVAPGIFVNKLLEAVQSVL